MVLTLAIKPQPPPLKEPITDNRGFVTPVWADFFQSLYRCGVALRNGVDDGTYQLSSGTTDGEITITDGVITGVQEYT